MALTPSRKALAPAAPRSRVCSFSLSFSSSFLFVILGNWMMANYAIVEIQHSAQFYIHRIDPDGSGAYSCFDCEKHRASYNRAYVSPYNTIMDGHVGDPPGFNQEWLRVTRLDRYEFPRKGGEKKEKPAKNSLERYWREREERAKAEAETDADWEDELEEGEIWE